MLTRFNNLYIRGTTMVGEKLGVIAKRLRVGQGGLAKKTGMSRVTISRFFNGHSELRATDFVRVCEELGVPLMGLIDDRLKQVYEIKVDDTEADQA
jgi:transcriptional regulator with XRE-family HTH domain